MTVVSVVLTAAATGALIFVLSSGDVLVSVASGLAAVVYVPLGMRGVARSTPPEVTESQNAKARVRLERLNRRIDGDEPERPTVVDGNEQRLRVPIVLLWLCLGGLCFAAFLLRLGSLLPAVTFLLGTWILSRVGFWVPDEDPE